MYKILFFLFLFFFSYKSFSNEVKILNETIGNGLEVKNHSKLSVHYIGRLEDNTVFDSSYDRGQFFDFQIGIRKVILGWETGLLGMREGGKRTIFIPYQLAYGESGAGNLIPPKSNLIFDIEVIKVIPPAYKEIDGYQLKLAMTDDFKIIDIRNEDQITNKNKIQGAIQITAFDKNGNSVTIDETKVAEEIKKLQAEYEANQYQYDRAISYPSLQDQLDMLYWDRKNGTKTW